MNSRQRKLAVLACFLWIMGFELGPNFHIGFHSLLPHHHHHGGKHSHHSHGRDHVQAPENTHSAPVASGELGQADHDSATRRGHHHHHHGPEHGAGSIEHRGVALVSAPPPRLLPVVITLEELRLPAPPSQAPCDRCPQCTRGRGPPVLSLS